MDNLRIDGFSSVGDFGTQAQPARSCSRKPLISVITAVLNGGKTIERTILSVINQDYDNVEYIVVDGGSTDETIDIIKQNSRNIKFWLSEPDGGIYDAFNKGIKNASGDWVYFLGADDYLADHCALSNIAQKFTGVPDSFNVVYADVSVVNAAGDQLHVIGAPWSKKLERRFWSDMCICHQGVFHRWSLFKKNGLYDVAYRISGDYELLLRELKTHKPFYLGPYVVASMQEGGVSSGRLGGLKLLNELRAARLKHGINEGSFRLFWRYVKVVIRIVIFYVFGDNFGGILIDLLRCAFGGRPYWTRI